MYAINYACQEHVCHLPFIISHVYCEPCDIENMSPACDIYLARRQPYDINHIRRQPWVSSTVCNPYVLNHILFRHAGALAPESLLSRFPYLGCLNLRERDNWPRLRGFSQRTLDCLQLPDPRKKERDLLTIQQAHSRAICLDGS